MTDRAKPAVTQEPGDGPHEDAPQESETRPAPEISQRSVTDDATQRRRLRSEVEQRRQLQIVLANAALVPVCAFLVRNDG